MPAIRRLCHGVFAAIAFASAGAALLAALNLGCLSFLKENFFQGLCADVWDGFFLSPLNLLGVFFLMYLPIHCYLTSVPDSILYLTTIMGVPSFLFFIAAFLETSPVILPIVIVVGSFAKFGWSEFILASSSSFHERPQKRSPPTPTRGKLAESVAVKDFKAPFAKRKRGHS